MCVIIAEIYILYVLRYYQRVDYINMIAPSVCVRLLVFKNYFLGLKETFLSLLL